MRKLLVAGFLGAVLWLGGAFTPAPQDDRIITVKLFSTEVSRNDGTAIAALGLNVDDYLRNPIVLIEHKIDTEYVVGKTLRLWREGVAWYAEILILPEPPGHEGEWLGDRYLYYYSHGICGVSVHVRGTSVAAGFEDINLYGPDVERVLSSCELLEITLCPIGAIPDALVVAP